MNNTTYTPRKLARKIAKANMKKAGQRKVNKLMQDEWKLWVFPDAKAINEHRKSKKEKEK